MGEIIMKLVSRFLLILVATPALAAFGSMAMFHMVGVTPEAPTLAAAFRRATPSRDMNPKRPSIFLPLLVPGLSAILVAGACDPDLTPEKSGGDGGRARARVGAARRAGSLTPWSKPRRFQGPPAYAIPHRIHVRWWIRWC